jgi:hypothetical protein
MEPTLLYFYNTRMTLFPSGFGLLEERKKIKPENDCLKKIKTK